MTRGFLRHVQPPSAPFGYATRVELAREENPRRAVATINARREDKDILVALQAAWSARHGRMLTQWDAFGLVLVAAMKDPEVAGLLEGWGPAG